jgi:hypothetical protein
MRIGSNLEGGTPCHQKSPGLGAGHIPFHGGGGFVTGEGYEGHQPVRYPGES